MRALPPPGRCCYGDLKSICILLINYGSKSLSSRCVDVCIVIGRAVLCVYDDFDFCFVFGLFSFFTLLP